MKIFINAFDFEQGFETLEGIYEVQSGVSKTVPDMTMSLREILQRYTRGGEVATFTPVYQDNPDEFDENPDISKMDPMERLQYALDLKSAIKRTKATLEERQKQFEAEKSVKGVDTIRDKKDLEKEASSEPEKKDSKESKP